MEPTTAIAPSTMGSSCSKKSVKVAEVREVEEPDPAKKMVTSTMSMKYFYFIFSFTLMLLRQDKGGKMTQQEELGKVF